MIDVCEPFEDFEYNAVGHYRLYFIIAETLLLLHLTILLVRTAKPATPTKLYVQHILFTACPIVPIRLYKSIFTAMFPYDASLSQILCYLLQIETTWQYFFSLSHLQMIALFAFLVGKHRSVSFEVTPTARNVLWRFTLFSLVMSLLFVNLRISSPVFCCIYAFSYCVCFILYIVFHYYALIVSTCKCYRQRKEDDLNDFSYLWFYFLQILATIAHFYQFCGISTFLVPVVFPRFEADYTIIFRSVTAVHAVRFMVNIILVVAPSLLLPPLRRQILKPILKLKQDRVAAVTDVRSPDQVHVTIT